MPDHPVGTSVGVDVDGQGGERRPAADQASGTAVPGGRVGAALARVAASGPLRWGFVVVAVGLGGYAIASDWTKVRDGLHSIGFLDVALGLACVLAAMVTVLQVYRVLLGALGSRLPARIAAQILFVGQLGKYLPGSVWPVIAQMELGAAHRVPRRRAASSAALAMLMSLLTGILVGLVMLPFSKGNTPYWWVFLFAPVILACMYPKVLNRILDLLLRLARRPALEQPLTGRAIGTALAWGVAGWIFYGLQIWVLADRLGLTGPSGLLLAVGAFAFAWSAGFLVVFVPAGAGVRELVLIGLLSPVIHVGPATAVALVSRALMTLGDLISAGAAAWFARLARAGAGGQPPT